MTIRQKCGGVSANHIRVTIHLSYTGIRDEEVCLTLVATKMTSKRRVRIASGLTKKQQAIADREVELVQLAKSLVQEQGFANLTMDKLTAASPYSKGTIYNHFCSKEDVILALCIHSLKSEAVFLSVRQILMATRVKRSLQCMLGIVFTPVWNPYCRLALLSPKLLG